LKISSLSPLLIIESPTAIDEAEAAAEASVTRLEVAPTGAAAASDNDGGHLDRETRDGLKRLSRIIQGKKLRTSRVLAIYRRVTSRENLVSNRGINLDTAG
jgi:hypothetical protein